MTKGIILEGVFGRNRDVYYRRRPPVPSIWEEKNMVSVIGDRHSHLRHRPGFEAPPLKSIGRDFIENPAARASRHHRTVNFAARGTNDHYATAIASVIGPLCVSGGLCEKRHDDDASRSRAGQ